MLKRITPSMLIALIALFVALGGTGVAATKALIGSKDIADHSIRLVDLHSSAAKELRGQPGVPGLNGTNGQLGPQGPIGPQGLAGQRGETGAQGQAGPQGTAGQRGETGATGPEGRAGPQGQAGPQGTTGQRGETGATGPEGQAGPQGTAGQRGETGAKGDRGETGAKGDQGPAGTVASYDELDGTPCTLHNGTAGITKVSKADGINGFDMGVVCIAPDAFEPNDSEAAATQLSTTGGGIGATIDHPGDSDWFQLLLPKTTTDVHVSNAGGLANSDDFTAELYRDGALVATGQPNGSWPGVSLNYSRPADGQSHEWKVHVTAGHLAQYTLYAYG